MLKAFKENCNCGMGSMCCLSYLSERREGGEVPRRLQGLAAREGGLPSSRKQASAIFVARALSRL